MRPLSRKRAEGIVSAARKEVSHFINPYSYNTTEYFVWKTSQKYQDVSSDGIINMFDRKELIV